jgi:hypothetical protein
MDEKRKPRRRWLVWALRGLGLAGLGLLLLASPMACPTTVVPPADPADPVTVFLLDHGRTPSLILPAPGGRMTRYVYGDWNYYALRNTGLGDGLNALLWPTQGTLGRRELPGPPDPEAVRDQVRVSIENLYPLVVGGAESERLRARLDAEHRAGLAAGSAEAYDLEFVPHPVRYTYFHNSNHMVAGWLRELGCSTRGPAFNSLWRVTSP